jgi:hypothetical protein
METTLIMKHETEIHLYFVVINFYYMSTVKVVGKLIVVLSAPFQLMSSVTSTAHAKALAKFEEGELTAVSDLMKWNVEGSSPTEQMWDTGSNNRKCWSSYKLMGKAYTMLTSIAMTLVADGGSNDVETE